MLELFSRLLAAIGYCVITMSSGKDALAWLAKHPLPALTLCDIRMNGGMSGYQFAEEFRKIDGSDYVWLVAFTVYLSEYVQKKAQASGFEGCIEKPWNEKHLADQLGAFVRP